MFTFQCNCNSRVVSMIHKDSFRSLLGNSLNKQLRIKQRTVARDNVQVDGVELIRCVNGC